MNTAALLDAITTVDPLSRYGKITKVIGLIAEAIGPPDVALGELFSASLLDGLLVYLFQLSSFLRRAADHEPV